MGTRNLTMVIDKKGELKIAQYGQWDGYPEGEGLKILNFAKNKDNIQKLEEQLPLCRFYNNCNDIERWLYGYKERTKIEYDTHISTDSRKKNGRNDSDLYWWDYLQSRDIGADILNNIIKIDKPRLPKEHNNYIYLYNDVDFAKDSLFCEWVYCINLQTNKLECFKGFNKYKEREYERFETTQEEIDENNGYCSIELIKEYDLDSLPNEDDFIKELNKLGYGEEEE